MFELTVFLAGIAIGSFLNVLVLRFHKELSIIKPGSHCFTCAKPIAWYDNIPVLSFLLLRGKCRYCKQVISWQYPMVEVVTGALLVWLAIAYGMTATFVVYGIFAIALIALFVYDLKYYILPDAFTLPALAFAFIANMWLGRSIVDLLIGIGIGGGFFLFQYVVSRGRWIGGGDIRLGAVMGAMLGWQHVIVALFLAYMAGSVIGVALIMAGKKQFSSRVPFGTFLTAATYITLLYGQPLLETYLSWTF